jgi:hypothetical protein
MKFMKMTRGRVWGEINTVCLACCIIRLISRNYRQTAVLVTGHGPAEQIMGQPEK